MILEEATAFFSEWKFNSGKIDVFHDLSELTIRTASRCLMGKEIRAQLHSNVARLYADLDAGFAPINVFFRWLPLPTYFNRDRANRIMTETFLNILTSRRGGEDTSSNSDVLQALMDARYKDGSKVRLAQKAYQKDVGQSHCASHDCPSHGRSTYQFYHWYLDPL